MKYLKKFEQLEEYNVGDYVIIKSDYFVDKKSRKGKIIEDDGSLVPYLVELLDDDLYIRVDMIERKLTPDEIYDFNLKLKTKKYNL